MASIVAYIEVREGAITAASLFAIGESRRIAQAAGATVYGLLALGPLSHVQIDHFAEQVSAAGADRILCSSDESLAGPVLDITHGPILAQITDHLRPVLLFFPAGGVGSELGPPLAVRIGAAYVPTASVEIHSLDSGQASSPQRIFVTRWRSARDTIRRIDLGDLERPVVAVLAAGDKSDFAGESYAEVEMIPYPTPKRPAERVLRSEVDSAAEVELCGTLVCVPSGTDAAELGTLRAALPHGVCVRTEDACDLGRASPQRLILLSVDQARLPIRAAVVREVAGTAAELAEALHRSASPDREPST